MGHLLKNYMFKTDSPFLPPHLAIPFYYILINISNEIGYIYIYIKFWREVQQTIAIPPGYATARRASLFGPEFITDFYFMIQAWCQSVSGDNIIALKQIQISNCCFKQEIPEYKYILSLEEIWIQYQSELCSLSWT